jgi:hypothetical protein
MFINNYDIYIYKVLYNKRYASPPSQRKNKIKVTRITAGTSLELFVARVFCGAK